MTTPSLEDLRIAAELRLLVRQANAAIQAIDAGIPMFPVGPKDEKINQDFIIGDFIVTPRVPKTDFQA
jgi:hypothetical protein